jgi:molybdopterin synthase sulfur carrier subunit
MEVHVSGATKRATGGQAVVEESAATLDELIGKLEARFPGFGQRLCDSEGHISRFVRVFVNGVDVRDLQGLQTTLVDTDQVRIVPAMAGG